MGCILSSRLRTGFGLDWVGFLRLIDTGQTLPPPGLRAEWRMCCWNSGCASWGRKEEAGPGQIDKHQPPPPPPPLGCLLSCVPLVFLLTSHHTHPSLPLSLTHTHTQTHHSHLCLSHSQIDQHILPLLLYVCRLHQLNMYLSISLSFTPTSTYFLTISWVDRFLPSRLTRNTHKLRHSNRSTSTVCIDSFVIHSRPSKHILILAIHSFRHTQPQRIWRSSTCPLPVPVLTDGTSSRRFRSQCHRAPACVAPGPIEYMCRHLPVMSGFSRPWTQFGVKKKCLLKVNH